jgi:hypothetical protein
VLQDAQRGDPRDAWTRLEPNQVFRRTKRIGDAVEDTGGFNSMIERLACRITKNLFPERDIVASWMPSVSITILKNVVSPNPHTKKNKRKHT